MRHVVGSRVPSITTCVLLLLLTASNVLAQTAPASKPFKEDELASLLAPIALYPDTVIAQILMASTYPMEVVEAHRFIEANKSMTAEALAAEAAKKGWDMSVQGLMAVPEVLKMMNEKLDWTQKVGDAFLAQQKEVIAMIQDLRSQAMEAGNLKSDDHMKVTTEPAPAESAAAAPQVIVIESADPQTVYVPTYSPTTVYGAWGYPSYPPYYWPPPMGYPGSGFWWGMGVGIAIGGAWGGNWGNDVDWNGGDINIGEINVGGGDRNRVNTGDRNRNSNNRSSDRSGNKWSHNPEHRKGTSYRDGATASKYNRGSTGASSRDSYRGRDSASTRNTGSGSRAGSTPSAGTRDLGSSPSASNRSSSPSASTRGSGTTGRDLGATPSTSSRGSSASASSRSSSSSRPSSSSTRSSGSSSRGSSSAFGGMSSGSRASSYGSRGGMSRGGGGGGRRR